MLVRLEGVCFGVEILSKNQWESNDIKLLRDVRERDDVLQTTFKQRKSFIFVPLSLNLLRLYIFIQCVTAHS